ALAVEFFRRLVAGIESVRRLEPRNGLVVTVKAIGLPRPVVRLNAQPGEILDDGVGKLAGRAADVGVVETQQEPATGLAGEQPVEQRCADIADMEQPGGAGREADAGVHRVSATFAEGVGDRITPVAAVAAAGNLDAGCGLAALVFGDVKQM